MGELAPKERMKAHCPTCDGERNCDIHGSLDVQWSEDVGHNVVSGNVQHRLLQCRGCETVFYHKSSSDSESWDFERDHATGEDKVVYPRSTETFPLPDKAGRKPEWLWNLHKHDLQLQAILQEAYDTFEAGNFILASVGLRTALDRATEVLKIDPGLSLAGKVERLKELGFVGKTEAADLAVVTDAGSAAAHRGWRPEPEEFERLLSTLERFLERTIVHRKSVEGIAIPPPHPRPKKNKSEPRGNWPSTPDKSGEE